MGSLSSFGSIAFFNQGVTPKQIVYWLETSEKGLLISIFLTLYLLWYLHLFDLLPYASSITLNHVSQAWARHVTGLFK